MPTVLSPHLLIPDAVLPPAQKTDAYLRLSVSNCITNVITYFNQTIFTALAEDLKVYKAARFASTYFLKHHPSVATLENFKEALE
jgi:hypothetical protein